MNLNEQSGLYASCTYNEDSLYSLGVWLKAHEKVIPNPISLESAHTTIVYSTICFERPNLMKIQEHIQDVTFCPIRFAVLGHTSEKALVLVLDADPLVALHDSLLECGASHGFDDYIPHLTVAYNISEDFDFSNLELPKIQLKPELIKFEPINLNWKSKELETSNE